MNKINYDKLFCECVEGLSGKPTLLLHSCCAPCSTLCIDRLKKHFDLTIFYYNPNMNDQHEYIKRKDEQIRYIQHLNSFGDDIKFVELGFCQEDFAQISRGHEGDKEGGARCYLCYELRLKKTFEFANAHGFDYFCTTLSVSPYKNAEWLNKIGFLLQTDKTKWLPTDFKKREGYKISRLMAREQNLYEQNYCGCAFSKTASQQNNVDF